MLFYAGGHLRDLFHQMCSAMAHPSEPVETGPVGEFMAPSSSSKVLATFRLPESTP